MVCVVVDPGPVNLILDRWGSADDVETDATDTIVLNVSYKETVSVVTVVGKYAHREKLSVFSVVDVEETV